MLRVTGCSDASHERVDADGINCISCLTRGIGLVRAYFEATLHFGRRFAGLGERSPKAVEEVVGELEVSQHLDRQEPSTRFLLKI